MKHRFVREVVLLRSMELQSLMLQEPLNKHQAVVKQGELLENPEGVNQHPSIYRNIIEGSTTNSRVLTDNAEDSNTDTSALPDFIGDDIV